jgi:hypothetical protein
MKTNEATPRQLNWLAAKCEGIVWEQGDLDAGEYGPGFAPATDWAHGGPIIEREMIELIPQGPALWDAVYRGQHIPLDGPTPLIAAMRCYVASKLGDELEVPVELQGGAE